MHDTPNSTMTTFLDALFRINSTLHERTVFLKLGETPKMTIFIDALFRTVLTLHEKTLF